MKRLSVEQLKSLSGSFSTVGSAWFVAATVNPLFSQSVELFRTIMSTVIGISIAFFFVWVSLYIIREI